jgi:Septum formation
MSLEATGNAQPAAVPPADTPPPAAAAPEAPADPAEPGPAEPAADAAIAGAPAIAEDDRAEPGELPGAADPGKPGEPARAAGQAGQADRADQADRAEQGERAEQGDRDAERPACPEQAELPEAPEPVELAGAAEAVELVGAAEPVEWGEPAHRRRGFALVVLFVVAALVIVGGAIATVGALTHGFHKPVKVKYQESGVFKLQTGDCVNTPNAKVVSVLPCSTPHQAEVFATFSLPASAWPGTATVRTEASSGCASRLAGYLNPQLAISLAQSYVFPDQVAWTAGTRTVICEVQATSGQLTGSVRAAS